MRAPDSVTSAFALRLFGPFNARLHGLPLARRRSRKGEWLLALLVLRHGRPVEREWLAGMLWPESPSSQALALMRRELTDLRRALGSEAGRLQAPTPHTLLLDLTGADVDLVAFDEASTRGDPASLERAVALYRGPLLEGCTAEWAFQERQAREEAHLGALERLAALAQREGDTAAAERHLRRAVAVDPLRESAQRALMRALAAGGSYAAVIETYRELRSRLHRELNAEPDAETQVLFEALRAEARRKAEAAPGPHEGPIVRDDGGETGRLEPADVAGLLAHLIEKSLVEHDPSSGTGRYRLLETVRRYAADRLREVGDRERVWPGSAHEQDGGRAAAVRERHGAYFLAMAESAAVQLRAARQVECLACLTTEEDNLRAALAESLATMDTTDHQPLSNDLGPRLTAALGLFWMIRSSFTEGREWLTRMLASPGGAAPAARARLLTWNGVLAFFQGDYALVKILLTEAGALCRGQDDAWHLSLGLTMRANVAMYEGDYEAASALNDESLSLARSLREPWLMASALRHEALRAYRQGDDANAAAAAAESVALFEQLGEKLMVVYSLIARGHIVHRQGDHVQAAALYGRSLLLAQAASNHRGTALGLAALGAVAAARGEGQRAARLFGAEARLRAMIGATMPRVYGGEYDHYLALTRAALGEAAFAAACAEGDAMSLEQACAYALQGPADA